MSDGIEDGRVDVMAFLRDELEVGTRAAYLLAAGHILSGVAVDGRPYTRVKYMVMPFWKDGPRS